jgi:hypothetical protein
MARKLKTYQTSIGFFDLAVAAPSMKVALDAWGSRSNLFHQGFAKETIDPAVVAATTARPGVVLRRPVGTNGAFTEDAVLPTNLSTGTTRKAPPKPEPTVQQTPTPRIIDKAAQSPPRDQERERKRIEADRRKVEAARERKGRQRKREIAKIEAVFEDAKKAHETMNEEIQTERAALDRRAQLEGLRWEKQKKQIEAKLSRVRE